VGLIGNIKHHGKNDPMKTSMILTKACTPSIRFLTQNSTEYPKRLFDLSDPPQKLFYMGNIHLLQQPMLAIVGARKASRAALLYAQYFATRLGLAGYHVISGLAYGVDGAAHTGVLSLEGKGQTIAVCGNGLDLVYPSEHRRLSKQIAKEGLLISEYPPGVGPKAFHFPRRNRIIAALGLGTIVIEAAQKSGSLITAYISAHLGREVFVVPGPMSSRLYEGSHRLIQEGAKLITRVEDVLSELPNQGAH
jgi:DNA processing protein